MDGDVETRLGDALAIAGDSPLLAFLDPFGTALPYQQMVDRLMLRGANLKTEVLLNLNLEIVWRIGGFLTGDETDEDRTASGRSAAQRVASEFCERVKAATGFGSFAVPIRRRPTHPPLFLMILFYRHAAAPYQFNDAVSGANGDWREHFRQLDLAEELAKQQTEPDLFGSEFTVEMSEKRRQSGRAASRPDVVCRDSHNIRSLLASQPALPVEARFADIYGPTMGLAREKHLRAAWDQLVEDGLIQPRNKKEKLRKLTIVRA